MAELLRIENLTTWLATRNGVIAAVDDISLSIEAGSTVGIVGESGSGKSMTCLSLLRLLPPNGRMTARTLSFKGEDLLAKSPQEMEAIRGSQIAMVLQDPMTSLNPLFTVGAQIGEMFWYHQGVRRWRACIDHAVKVLKEVGIPAAEDRVKAYPHQFSGGMRQRVSIGMNIACRPDLLVADEPTTALDVTVQLQILRLLRDVQQATGMTIMLVTHDLHMVARFCDRVVIMYAGRIVEEGPVADVFENPGHPYTDGLLHSIPGFDTGSERLTMIPGQPPSMADLPEGCRFAPRCPHADEQCRAAYPSWVELGENRRVACWKAEERQR